MIFSCFSLTRLPSVDGIPTKNREIETARVTGRGLVGTMRNPKQSLLPTCPELKSGRMGFMVIVPERDYTARLLHWFH